jgi:hypothetical protein
VRFARSLLLYKVVFKSRTYFLVLDRNCASIQKCVAKILPQTGFPGFSKIILLILTKEDSKNFCAQTQKEHKILVLTGVTVTNVL